MYSKIISLLVFWIWKGHDRIILQFKKNATCSYIFDFDLTNLSNHNLGRGPLEGRGPPLEGRGPPFRTMDLPFGPWTPCGPWTLKNIHSYYLMLAALCNWTKCPRRIQRRGVTKDKTVETCSNQVGILRG